MKHDFNTLHLLHSIREIPPSLINAQEKYVLLMILACVNLDNDTWYSQDSIAHFCSMSERRVAPHIRSLAAKSFILIEKPTTYGRSKSNHYHLNVDVIMAFYKGEKGDKTSSFKDRKGDKTSEKGRQNVREKGDETSYKERNRRRKEEGATDGSLEPPRPIEPKGVPCPPELKARLDELFNRHTRKQTAH